MPLPLPRSRIALGSLAIVGIALLLLGAGTLLLRPVPLGAAATIGGPFTLTDQDGRTVTADTFRGHPFLVFFGYTHCPDVCPTTLASMSQTLQALGGEAMPALFVTVDPVRDTAPVLKDYLSSFDPRIRGLTGTPAAVEAAEKAYRVYAQKMPTANGDYSMDHTSVVYLMDAQGRFVNAVNLEQPPEAAAAALKRDL